MNEKIVTSVQCFFFPVLSPEGSETLTPSAPRISHSNSLHNELQLPHRLRLLPILFLLVSFSLVFQRTPVMPYTRVVIANTTPVITDTTVLHFQIPCMAPSACSISDAAGCPNTPIPM